MVALVSQHSDDFAFAVGIAAFSILMPVAIGLLWWRRRATWRTGTLLVALGGVIAVYGLVNADLPLLYALGIAAEPLATALVFGLLIGFPEGAFSDRYGRVLMATAALALAILYLPALLAAPELHSVYPAYDCAPCPPNPFKVLSIADSTMAALRDLGAMLLIVAALAVSIEFVRRTLAATGPPRRMLAAIGWTSLLLLPAMALYHAAGFVLAPTDELLTTATIAVVVLWFVFPLGFTLPFVGEDVVAASTLSALLGDLSEPRRRDRWRDQLAAALGDAQLQVGFWDEQSASYLDRAGNVLQPIEGNPDRVWLEVDDDGRQLAALIVDRSLTYSPEVVSAAALATAAAVEADRIETTRRDLLGRAATAAVSERSRMARTVQAGAQQRLAAMRVAVNMAAEGTSRGRGNDFLTLVATELDAAINELRVIVWAGGSAAVSRRGLGSSLRSVTKAAPTTVRVLDRGLQRSHPQTELAVYYCCLEALQNAIKHAGRDVPVTIRLRDGPEGGIAFSVADEGAGFDDGAEQVGVGLQTMRDRVELLGGWLKVATKPGHGTVITGWVPSETRSLMDAASPMPVRP